MQKAIVNIPNNFAIINKSILDLELGMATPIPINICINDTIEFGWSKSENITPSSAQTVPSVKKIKTDETKKINPNLQQIENYEASLNGSLSFITHTNRMKDTAKVAVELGYQSIQKKLQKMLVLSEEIQAILTNTPQITQEILDSQEANTQAAETRNFIFNSVTPLIGHLGYDPTPMLKADAKRRIKEAFESGTLPEFKAQRGRGNKSEPLQYIQDYIIPLLTAEQTKYAKTDIDLYSFLAIKNGVKINNPFYSSLYRTINTIKLNS